MEQYNKNNEGGGPKAECAARNSESEKKRVYISGPIGGYAMEERHEAFGLVKEMLMKLGYEPISPMDNRLPDDSTREEHMKADLSLLMTCEYIYQMRGWTESKGAVLETLVARQLGIEVLANEDFYQAEMGHNFDRSLSDCNVYKMIGLNAEAIRGCEFNRIRDMYKRYMLPFYAWKLLGWQGTTDIIYTHKPHIQHGN